MLEKEENLVLVDENDEVLGYAPKMLVHQRGNLHRAFSVLIFNSKNEMLIHQRANHKYHSSNLWTNACCSHPREGEKLEEAVHRRLKEEMGFDCNVRFAYKFIYKAELENGLIEHELDHVFIGEYNESFTPNPDEVSDFKWVPLSFLRNDIVTSPQKYTHWFRIIVTEHLKGFHFPKKEDQRR